jgi:hypothetical protein
MMVDCWILRTLKKSEIQLGSYRGDEMGGRGKSSRICVGFVVRMRLNVFYSLFGSFLV